MTKAILPIAATLLFACAAFAQSTSPSEGQGTTSASPSMQQDSTQTGQTGSMGNNGHMGSSGEKKMKGCVQSEGGQYVLQEKSGKTIPLAGQDVSAHVGHTVTVHGSWASGSSASASSGSASGNAFNVTSVDMVSTSCNVGKNKSNGGMQGDSGTKGTQGSGTGAMGEGSGSTTSTPPR